ncbi:hypothetical protein DXT87_16110 [Arthrobacter sp. AET 35A]|nr:hypothetical protein [Arthrobacter sp. AET 35A]
MLLLVSTCVVGAVVLATAITAMILLTTDTPATLWTPILQEIVKVSYQALAIGVLGGLAKLLLDRGRDREASANELRERRHQYISDVIEASHQIDNARLVMRANRSVLTWTTMVNSDLIPARTRLRQLTHSLRNWTEAGRPVFDDGETIARDLVGMYLYLGELVEEYAEHKMRLSEMQKLAEKADGHERSKLLTEIWDNIQQLKLTGDYLADGDRYASYRRKYLRVLGEMRSSLLNS